MQYLLMTTLLTAILYTLLGEIGQEVNGVFQFVNSQLSSLD